MENREIKHFNGNGLNSHGVYEKIISANNLLSAKVSIRKYHQGVDFLGYICFPHFRILRTKTKRRMLRKLEYGFNKDSFISYLGPVKHSRSNSVRLEMAKKII